MLTYNEAYKFVEDNIEMEFENTMSKEKLTEIYRTLYETNPRSRCNKAGIAAELRLYVDLVESSRRH